MKTKDILLGMKEIKKKLDKEGHSAQKVVVTDENGAIITSENIIPTRETSIVIFMDDRTLKTHLKFVRCEAYGDEYKLSFIFTDLSERDFEMLSNLCVYKQITSF